MRTIPQAVGWETVARGGWKWLSLFILCNALPLMIFGALSRFGLPTTDPAYLMLHFTLVPILVFLFIVNITAIQGPINRLYTSPVSNSTLVSLFMAIGGAILCIQLFLSVLLHNFLFHVNWPIFSPLVFALGFWSLAQPLIRQSKHSIIGIASGCIPMIVYFAWYKSKMGDLAKTPSHFWRDLNVADCMILFAVVLASYFSTLFQVSKDRCGEEPHTVRLSESLKRKLLGLLPQSTHPLKKFSSTKEAQSWYEWTPKGAILPGIISVLLLLGVIGWIPYRFTSNDSQPEATLLMGSIGFQFYLIVFSILAGIVMGLSTTNTRRSVAIWEASSKPDAFRIGDFQSSLPISDRQLASAVMWTSFKSSLMAWSICVVAILLCWMLAWSTNQLSTLKELNVKTYSLIAISYLGPWIAISNVAAACLTGRVKQVAIGFVALPLLLILLMLIAGNQESTSEPWKRMMLDIVPSGLMIAIVVFAIVLFSKAYRDQHLDAYQMLKFGFIFVAVMLVLVAVHITPNLTGSVIVGSTIAALTVLPLAAAPVAVAWNRHR